VGEVLVGIALIIGAFVGVAAFFVALMNWNYIMVGTASSNGLLLGYESNTSSADTGLLEGRSASSAQFSMDGEEIIMAHTPEQVGTKLKQISGGVKKHWGHLSEVELQKIKEESAAFVGKIQKRYGTPAKTLPPTE
jgi:uncharacterized protein YjbJ (UPF0337 family)